MLLRPHRTHVVPLSPALLVAAANAFADVSEQGEENRGQWAELGHPIVRLPRGLPWCAAFVHHVGRAAHYDQISRRSSWPLPATAGCEALAQAAQAQGVLRDKPDVGDVFLIYNRTRRRFFHTGIVVGVQEEERVHARDVHLCVTVEGHTNDDGSGNAHTTQRQLRTFREADGHRFIRWAEMERRAIAA